MSKFVIILIFGFAGKIFPVWEVKIVQNFGYKVNIGQNFGYKVKICSKFWLLDQNLGFSGQNFSVSR